MAGWLRHPWRVRCAFQAISRGRGIMADIVPANTGTGSTVSVGGSVTGTIDASGDQDWYQVTLVAGRQYRFDLQGAPSGQGTLGDTLLRLLNGSGVVIDLNDDSGGTLE